MAKFAEGTLLQNNKHKRFRVKNDELEPVYDTAHGDKTTKRTWKNYDRTVPSTPAEREKLEAVRIALDAAKEQNQFELERTQKQKKLEVEKNYKEDDLTALTKYTFTNHYLHDLFDNFLIQDDKDKADKALKLPEITIIFECYDLNRIFNVFSEFISEAEEEFENKNDFLKKLEKIFVNYVKILSEALKHADYPDIEKYADRELKFHAQLLEKFSNSNYIELADKNETALVMALDFIERKDYRSAHLVLFAIKKSLLSGNGEHEVGMDEEVAGKASGKTTEERSEEVEEGEEADVPLTEGLLGGVRKFLGSLFTAVV